MNALEKLASTVSGALLFLGLPAGVAEAVDAAATPPANQSKSAYSFVQDRLHILDPVDKNGPLGEVAALIREKVSEKEWSELIEVLNQGVALAKADGTEQFGLSRLLIIRASYHEDRAEHAQA